METRHRRSPGRRRQKRSRRLRRRIQAWIARVLVLAVAAMLLFLSIKGASWLWRRFTVTETASFSGAVNIGEMEWVPGEPVIALDAGHGGKDQGTCSGDILEKDLNLLVVKRLAEKLQEEGMNVLLTRGDDTFVELENRAELANEEKADRFISIHCNCCEDDSSVQGLECYYREGSTEGEELADRIVQAMEEEERIVSRGARTADYRVLRKTDMPAVLVELGYLSNPEECEKLTDEAYQEALVERIAEALLTYSSP